MTDVVKIGQLKLAKVRLSHPALFKPKPGMDDPTNLKYQAAFLIPKTNIVIKKQIEAAYEEVCKAAFNGKVPKFEGDRYPLRDGDAPKKTGEDRGLEYQDMFYISAKSDKRPVLKNGQKQTLIDDQGVLYAGCYVNALLSLYAVNKEKIKGVFTSLDGVMFAAHGEAFGAAPVSDSEFDDFEDAADDEEF